jgi:hypothetical protein
MLDKFHGFLGLICFFSTVKGLRKSVRSVRIYFACNKFLQIHFMGQVILYNGIKVMVRAEWCGA